MPLKNIEKKYKVRKKVLNMNLKQWGSFEKLPMTKEVLNISPKEFLEKIGLVGCLTAYSNDEEDDFFDKLYELYRKG